MPCFFVLKIPAYEVVFYFPPKSCSEKRDRMCICHTANTFACMKIPPVRAGPDTPNVETRGSL